MASLNANDEGSHPRHVLIVGGSGAGCSRLAKEAWRKSHLRAYRSYVAVNCASLKTKHDLMRLMATCYDGDIYLDHLQMMKPSLWQWLLERYEGHAQGRILASCSLSSAGAVESWQNFFPIVFEVPPLMKRPKDLRAIVRACLGDEVASELCCETWSLLESHVWQYETAQLLQCMKLFWKEYRHHKNPSLSYTLMKQCLKWSESDTGIYRVSNFVDADTLFEASKSYGIRTLMQNIESALYDRASAEAQGCSSQAAAILQIPLSTFESRKKNIPKSTFNY